MYVQCLMNRISYFQEVIPQVHGKNSRFIKLKMVNMESVVLIMVNM